MTGILEPGGCARRSLLRRALGAGVVVLIGTVARKAAAREDEVVIDNFTFSPTPLISKRRKRREMGEPTTTFPTASSVPR